MIDITRIEAACSEAVLAASIGYEPAKIKVWEKAIETESEENSRWILEMLLENAYTAREKRLPMCDDTGIPYVLIEIGRDAKINGNPAKIIDAAEAGIAEGLRRLPGRPMAVKGDSFDRITQEKGLYEDSGMVFPSPVRMKSVSGSKIKITVLLQGGGPEIRGRTYRVFHHHNLDTFRTEIAGWAVEMARLLGCTPCVPAIGVGRTHYEANCLMMDAMAYGVFGEQNDLEKFITEKVNESNTGPLGIGGKITALQTFSRIGYQRASGIRVVSMRVGCIVDPRRHSLILE
ncbi:MAG: fumarate hydratase [Spirochaetales bacterium]|uniref:Fumarate hydratase n=1 Tax=Candidatus Thalassospirochaeta sargassi TaxID=3119039 RepID=A0AAJ1MN91_9SPIO|nr:fumarate hydratase [Spirochaetales bacterium]